MQSEKRPYEAVSTSRIRSHERVSRIDFIDIIAMMGAHQIIYLFIQTSFNRIT